MTDFSVHLRRIVTGKTVGEDVSWDPARGLKAVVRGVFRAPYTNVDLGAFQIGGNNPSIEVMSADVPYGAAEGDEIVIRGTLYTVSTIEPNVGAGMTLIRLDAA